MEHVIAQAILEAMTARNGISDIPSMASAISHNIMEKGYQITSLADQGLTPQSAGAIETHTVFQALQDEGFTREEAFELVKLIFQTNVEAGRRG